jgi:hypothetical protein
MADPWVEDGGDGLANIEGSCRYTEQVVMDR